MFLSRLTLNPKDRQARRDLANPMEMHRTLSRCFPSPNKPSSVRKQYGVLYRVDLEPRIGVPTVLVQSDVMPEWSCLVESQTYFLETDSPNPESKDLRAYESLREGQVLTFRLRANPTLKTRLRPDGTEGTPHRVPLRKPDEQTAWLQRKGEQGGFTLVSAGLGDEVLDVLVKCEQDVFARKTRGGRMMTFGSVVFEGRLRILNLDRFRETLADGIGPAKAFGFGLLSVARV